MTAKDNKTEKPTKDDIQSLNKKVDETIQSVNIKQAEIIGKENKMYYKRIKELASQIEDKTKEIFSLYFDKDQIDMLFNDKEIIYNIVLKDYVKHKEFIDEWQKAIKKVNNSFTVDNFFLLFNSVFERLQSQTKEEKQKDFDALIYANNLMYEKDELIKEFDELDDKITNNNRQIADLEKEYFNTLKKENIKDDKGQEIKASIMTTGTLKIISRFFEYLIDAIELFNLNNKTRTQLKVFIETEEKDKDVTLIMRIKKDRNYMQSYVNIDIKDIVKKDTALTTYQPNAINTYKVFNDKVSNTLSELINNQKETITGTGGTKYKDLEIKALISNAEIKQSKVLSQWDKYILQAIYSVSINNPYFDINMIKRALNLKSYKKKTSINDEIKASIEKMSITKISLDIAKELNETYKTPLNADKIKALEIESYLLPLEKIYKKVGGAKQEMYYFIKKPIYFTYIEARNQILNLATEKLFIYRLTDTKENTMLKIYLKTRIDDMKYQKNKSKTNNYIDTILYDTIFKENDLLQDKELQKNEKAYNKKRDTYRNTIKEILKHYKDIKDIKDYKEIRENRKFTKIQIIL